jgi:hypothetical protein
MTTSDYRSALRAQLADAAPAAVAMLRGERPPDAVVLLAALEAASLLDEVTVGADQRAARAAVLAAAPGSAALPWLTGTALDLRPVLMPDDELERHTEVQRWVSLAALLPLLPAGASRRVQEALDDIQGHLVAHPDAYGDLAPLARWTLDQLDLPGGHPAVLLLRELEATQDTVPLPAAAVARAYQRAQAQLFPVPASWLNALISRVRGDVAAFLDTQRLAPVQAFATDQGLVAAPRARQLLWEGGGQFELCLVVDARAVVLELMPAAAAILRLDGQALPPAPSLVEGACCWALPKVLPDGPLELRLEVEGAEHRILLGRDD